MDDEKRPGFSSSQNSNKWKILGLDTFEADSLADTPGAGWYEIKEFDTEAKALALAASELSTWHPKSHIAEQIFLLQPDGKKFRCVLPPCPNCALHDSMQITKELKQRPWWRVSKAQYECKLCGFKEWRELDNICLIGRLAWE